MHTYIHAYIHKHTYMHTYKKPHYLLIWGKLNTYVDNSGSRLRRLSVVFPITFFAIMFESHSEKLSLCCRAFAAYV